MSRARQATKSDAMRFDCTRTAVIALIMLFMVACHDSSPVQAEFAKAAPAATQTENVRLRIPSDSIRLADLRMQRSVKISMTGDLRPLYVVSGRIWNCSANTLKSVTLRFPIIADSATVDDPHLQLDISVPPNGVGSFSREISFLPPSRKWEWTYGIVEAQGLQGGEKGSFKGNWFIEHAPSPCNASESSDNNSKQN